MRRGVSARGYERRHPEIFNPVEQARLRDGLRRALAAVTSETGRPPRALDFGCGTGNVTRRLLELGADVVAADVAPELLRVVEQRFAGAGVETALLNGIDLAGWDDDSLDFVASYSVLHHVHDYLAIVDEMLRVLRPGGVLYVDHEANELFYDRDGCVWELRRAAREHELARPGAWNPARRRWQRLLVPRNYRERWRRWRDPGYPWNAEGDIHVWEWDHIDWPALREHVERGGAEVVVEEDYLNFSSAYPGELWQSYAGQCADMRVLIARKRPAAAP
ncbi:MAG: class I SAM-dependent methyltransferase [Thermoleophilaceae bacterium]